MILQMMKLLLVVLFATFCSCGPFTQFLTGFIYGAEEEVGDIDKCVHDVGSLITHYSETFEDFKSGLAEKSITDVEDGFIALAEALIDTIDAFKDCGIEELLKDVSKLTEELASGDWIEVLLKEGWYILWHGKQLYDEVKDCVQSYESGNYYEMGVDIGELVIQLLKASE